MNSFNTPDYKNPDLHQEIAAIYTIVSRNLQPENWFDLVPEARAQMFAEIVTLLASQALPRNQKQQLLSLVECNVPACEVKNNLLANAL
ncbi:MAG: hypothetical protein AAGC93_26660 [Cyanobacteria bacterium P01_F01_bin.53]